MALMIMLVDGLAACASVYKKTDPVTQPNQKAAEYNLQLGIDYLQEGLVEKAQEKLELAEAQAPDWPPLLDGLAYFYETTGQSEKANTYYLRALALAPKGGATNNNYGTYLCREQHYQAAIEHFKIAVADPNYTDAAGALENAGACAALIPNPSLAYHYFKQAFQRDPSRPLPLLKLAEHAYDEHHYRSAEQLLHRYHALTAKPTREALEFTIKLAKQTANETLLQQAERALAKQKKAAANGQFPFLMTSEQG